MVRWRAFLFLLFLLGPYPGGVLTEALVTVGTSYFSCGGAFLLLVSPDATRRFGVPGGSRCWEHSFSKGLVSVSWIIFAF